MLTLTWALCHHQIPDIRPNTVFCEKLLTLIGTEVVFSLGLTVVNIRVVIGCSGWGVCRAKGLPWMSSEDVIFIRLLVSIKSSTERKIRK